MKNDIVYIKNLIEIGYTYKKKKIKSKYSKYIYKILKMLYERGYIYKFNIFFDEKNIKFIDIYLKYYLNRGVIKGFFVFNLNKQKVNKSIYKLSKVFNNNNGMILISNSFGILSLKDTLLHSEGGILLMKIF